MTTVNTTTTVAVDPVSAAAAAIPLAMERFEASTKAYVAAEAAQKVAEDAAAHPRHDADAATLLAAVEAADAGVRRAGIAATIAAGQVAACRAHHAAVLSESLAPEEAAGRADRMEACKRIDDARAALTEGFAAFHAATGRLNTVYASGRKRPFDGARLAPAWPIAVDPLPPTFWQVNEAEIWGAA